MSEWEFRDPWFLTCVVLAPLAAWWMLRPRGEANYSSLEIIEPLPRSWRQMLRGLPAISVALSILCLSLALARPRSPRNETRVHGEGIAIMLVVDRSGSMDARDLVPTDVQRNRLAVVKEVLRAFLMGESGIGRGRPNDVVGLVSFAGFADGVCPLTLDHGNLTQLIDETEIASRDEDGTAIGDGLGLAVARLRESPATSKVIVLLTDGENNAGVVDPIQAGRLAQDSKIRVYCIGAGTRGIAPIPQRDPFGRIRLQAMPVSIDEDTLKRIAQLTGGRYFRATDVGSLIDIYTEIDKLERTEISEVRYLQYNEHFTNWLLIGFGLLVAGVLADSLWFRVAPC